MNIHGPLRRFTFFVGLCAALLLGPSLAAAEAVLTGRVKSAASGFVQELIATAEQLTAPARWQRILRRSLLENYPTNGPDRPRLAAPA